MTSSQKTSDSVLNLLKWSYNSLHGPLPPKSNYPVQFTHASVHLKTLDSQSLGPFTFKVNLQDKTLKIDFDRVLIKLDPKPWIYNL